MTDPTNGTQLFLVLCMLMMVAAPAVSWSVIPERQENSVKLWFIGSVMLAMVGIVYYWDQSAVTAYYIPNVGAALLALEALHQEQQPRPVPWLRLGLIMAVVAVVHEIGHNAVLADTIPEAWVLGPRVLLVTVLDVVLLVQILKTARRHQSRGMALVALGIAPLAVLNLVRVVAIAAGSGQMAPRTGSEVFPLMAMLMTFTAVTYNFGFLAFALERAHARSRLAVEQSVRAQEREAAARTHSEELRGLIRQRDEMLMNTTRLAAVSAMGLYNAAIVHEITQPLQALRSTLDSLRLRLERPDFDRLDEVKDGLARASALHAKASDLIQSLRRLIAARQSSLASIPLHDAIREVEPVLRSECERRGIALTVQLSPELETTHILAEALLLQRMLMNLVGNSMDALSRVPGVQREIRVLTQPALLRGGPALLIRIEDNGPGFPTDILHNNPTTPMLATHKLDGVGVGLVLTRLVMDAWKGAVVLGTSSAGRHADAQHSAGAQAHGARVDLLAPLP